MQGHDLSSRWLLECRDQCARNGDWGQQRQSKCSFLKANCKSGQEGFFFTSIRGIDLKIRQRLTVKEVQCKADHSSHRVGLKKSWKWIYRFPHPQEFVCCLKQSTHTTQPSLCHLGRLITGVSLFSQLWFEFLTAVNSRIADITVFCNKTPRIVVGSYQLLDWNLEKWLFFIRLGLESC